MGTVTIQTSNSNGFINKIIINDDKKRIFVNTNGNKNFSLEYEGCSMTYTDDMVIYEFFRKEETSQVAIELTGTDDSDKMRIVLPISVKSLWPKTDFRFECGEQMELIESELNKLVTCDTLFIVDNVVETKHKKKGVLPFKERFLGIEPVSRIMKKLRTDGFKVDLKYSLTESKTIDVVGLTTGHDKSIDFYDYIIGTVDGDRIDVVFDKRNSQVRFHGIPGVGYKQFDVCRKDIDIFEKMACETYDLFREYEPCSKLVTGRYFDLSSKIVREKNKNKFELATSFDLGSFLFGEIDSFSKQYNKYVGTIDVNIKYKRFGDVFIRIYLKSKKAIVRGVYGIANKTYFFDSKKFHFLKLRVESVDLLFKKYKYDLKKFVVCNIS